MRGVYFRTERHKKAISLAKLGCKYPNRKSPPSMSEETKKKISEAHRGNKYALGMKHTEEWKENARQRMLGNPNGFKKGGNMGNKHFAWIEDRTQLAKYKNGNEYRNSPAHREWSRQVKNRDGWICKISNDDCSGQVVAHHILSWREYAELRYEINNGITLCRFHHPRKRMDEMKLSPYFQSLVISNRN